MTSRRNVPEQIARLQGEILSHPEASGGFPGGIDGPAPQAIGARLSVPAPYEKRVKSDRVTIHRPIKSPMSREDRERAVHLLTQILVTHLRQTEEPDNKLRDVSDAR